MCLITLHLPDTVRREMSSRIYCQFVSERWQFISNHYVSKIEGCAEVEIQLHSSQRWRASALHMRLQCVCGLEIWPSQPASLFPTMDRAPEAAGLPLPKSAGPLCSEACSHLPYLPSPLSRLCWLRAPGSTPPFWCLPWHSGLLLYLASEKQLSLSNSSLNLDQPLPPTPP